MAKLIVALMRDRPMPGKSPVLNVPLERRVEYALDCIDAEHESADEARAFLRKVRDRLDNEHLQSRVDRALSEGTPHAAP